MFVLSIAIFILVLLILYYMQSKFVSFNKRVFLALVLGLLFGWVLHYILNQDEILSMGNVLSIVGTSYIRLLQMIIYPIILIATIKAMTQIGENKSVSKALFLIIIVLLITTAISASIGIATAYFSNLSFEGLLSSNFDQSVLKSLEARTNIFNSPFYVFVTDFIPTNPFADLAGLRANSIPALVIFAVFLGVAYLGVLKKEPEVALKFKSAVEVIYKIIMRLVVVILRLTPYGIFALISKLVAQSNVNEILSLLKFLASSYVAILAMFIVHGIIILAFRYNVFTYYKKVFPLLIFAFVSRSSSASIPMNINTQSKKLGINEGIATISSSFGTIVGQNGCAGIYPAMLAFAMAPLVGIDPTSISFIITLIAVVVISSFGIAGVGGGATFAAVAVLGTFNMPLAVVAILIGIEPLIDMARTALNINGSIVSSLVSSKIYNEVDMTIFNDNNNQTNNNEGI